MTAYCALTPYTQMRPVGHFIARGGKRVDYSFVKHLVTHTLRKYPVDDGIAAAADRQLSVTN